MVNVLVFPAHTETALEIRDALKDLKTVRLFGGACSEGLADFVFETCFHNLPAVDSPLFADSLNAVIDSNHIDYIFPAQDDVLKPLSDLREQFHAVLLASPPETIEICSSYTATYSFFKGRSFIPEFYSSFDRIPSYPVSVLPDPVNGLDSARRIKDREHLEDAFPSAENICICEPFSGTDYSVDCFTDADRKLLVTGLRSKERVRAGISVRSRILPADSRISAIAEEINSGLVFRGAWFFTVRKRSDGEYRLLAVFPRIAETMGLIRSIGINMPSMTLSLFCGERPNPVINHNRVLVDRAFCSRFKTDISYSSIYVDFDDTLLVNGKVNTALMMFLYQSFNKGKNIILLTRHANDIYSDLDRFHIPCSLFHEIIHITDNREKADYIKPDSVFIDDSFAERERIHSRCNIPVFDIDMIESLLDWKV